MYNNLGIQISSGIAKEQTIYFKAPLYPYFLALIYYIFGVNLMIPRILQHIMGISIIVIIYLMTLKIYSKKAAIISAFFMATYNMFIYFEGEILITTLSLFLDLLGLYLIFIAKNKNKIWLWVISGLCFGFSAISRPTILGVIPAIILWIFYNYFYESKSIFKKEPLFRILTFSVGLLIPIVPITGRNYLIGNDITVISTQGGIAFYTGNNIHSDGMYGVPAGFKDIGGNWEYYDCVQYAEKKIGRNLKPSEVSDFYYKEGIKSWHEYPKEMILLFLKKFILFWNNFEISNNRTIPEYKNSIRTFKWLPWNFSLIACFGITGFPLLFREPKKREKILLFTFLTVYCFLTISFFMASRYRIPVIPILIISGSGSLTTFFQAIKDKKIKIACIMISSYILFYILTSINYFNLQNGNRAQYNFALASAYMKQNDRPKARSEFLKTLQLDPVYPRAHLNLGVLYYEEGNKEKALEEYQYELNINPFDEMPYNNIGVIMMELENWNEAIKDFKNAIDRRPNYFRAYRNLALSFERYGNIKSSIKVLEKAIEVSKVYVECPTNIYEIYRDLATYNFKDGNLEKAVENYKKAIKLNPRNPQNYNDIGLVYAAQRLFPSAIENFTKAIGIDSLYLAPWINLGNIYLGQKDYKKTIETYEKAMALSPNDNRIKFNLALAFLGLGEKDKSLLKFEEILRSDNNFPGTNEWIEILKKK